MLPELIMLLTGAMNKSVPKAPADRNVFGEGLSTLHAMRALGPQEFALEKAFGQQASDAQNEIFQDTLFGTEGGHRVAKYNDFQWVPPVYEEQKKKGGGLLDTVFGVKETINPLFGGLFGGKSKAKKVEVKAGYYKPVQRSLHYDVAAKRGLMDQFGEEMGFSPLLKELQSQAASELEHPYELNPAIRRELEQASLGDASMRGFGHSPIDAYMTYSSLGSAAQDLAARRRNFAGEISKLSESLYMPAVQAAFALTGDKTKTPDFNPTTAYGADVANTNFNAAYTNRYQAQNYNAAIQSALINSIGQQMGSILGGAGGAAGGMI